ncbi:MAG: hypothetical protein NTW74_15910 [Acidobacteria bacterium]|nr:hypothetical protein [Acidobacteriota bacterium]
MRSPSKQIGLVVILAADVFLIATDSIRSSLIVMQLMMILTVMIIVFSRSKTKDGKQNTRSGGAV